MYEVGIAPIGQYPTSWKTLANTNGLLYLDLWDDKSNLLSNANNLTIYTRIKGCDSIYFSFAAYIKTPPNSFGSMSINCFNGLVVRPWTDYDGHFCYPVVMQVRNSSGVVIATGPASTYTQTGTAVSLGEYYGTFSVTYTDVKGTSATVSYPAPSFSSVRYLVASCNNYRYAFNTTTSNGKSLSCYDYAGIVTYTETATGIEVGKDTLRSSGGYSMTNTILNYGVAYTVRIDYPIGTFSNTSLAAVSLPARIVVTTNTDAANFQCTVDSGRLNITPGATGSNRFPPNTTITITGPTGFTPQPQVINTPAATTNSTTLYSSFGIYPEGEYTFSINDGQCIQDVKHYHYGIYGYKDFDFDAEMTCSGLKITPKGNITFAGSNTSTFYRLVSGPAGSGYDTRAITPGNSFLLTMSGTYRLGILGTNSSTACAIATIDIVYTASSLSLDTQVTSAYVCVGDNVGNITIKAINGVAPYTYSVWNEANNEKVYPDDVISNGAAYFKVGAKNVTYTIRVRDACGSNFNQQVTMSDLELVRIVYTSNGTGVCYGEALELKCLTLGETTYHWTGPNGYTSDEQNPVIENFGENMEGYYKVTVLPQYCGNPVVDSIYVSIYQPLNISNTVTTAMMCTGTSIVPQLSGGTVSGGSEIYAYQWQYLNSSSEWVNISGAESATYTPPYSMIDNGFTNYRMVVTNSCGTATSDTIQVVVQLCSTGISVNPNLMNRATQ
jgi:hypothetical protein